MSRSGRTTHTCNRDRRSADPGPAPHSKPPLPHGSCRHGGAPRAGVIVLSSVVNYAPSRAGSRFATRAIGPGAGDTNLVTTVLSGPKQP